MYYDDSKAWNDRCPAFRDKVLAAFINDRNSALHPSLHARYNNIFDKRHYSNEAIFHEEMVPLILKDNHTVATDMRDLRDQMITVVKSYADNDGLRSQDMPYLAKGFVPARRTP